MYSPLLPSPSPLHLHFLSPSLPLSLPLSPSFSHSQESVPPTSPTLLHCAALNNQTAVVEWLQGRTYPPHTKCRRILDLDGRVLALISGRLPPPAINRSRDLCSKGHWSLEEGGGRRLGNKGYAKMVESHSTIFRMEYVCTLYMCACILVCVLAEDEG